MYNFPTFTTLTSVFVTDKRTDPCSRLLCITLKFHSNFLSRRHEKNGFFRAKNLSEIWVQYIKVGNKYLFSYLCIWRKLNTVSKINNIWQCLVIGILWTNNQFLFIEGLHNGEKAFEVVFEFWLEKYFTRMFL